MGRVARGFSRAARFSRASPAPGDLIDVGGFRLHLNCQGGGSPAVIFDAALGGSSLSWSLVQSRIASITRACSYDRAGFGWSDAGPTPRTAGRCADELAVLLRKGGVSPPYVLVGHSFGALVTRILFGRQRENVAGVVFVEPAFPEDWIVPNAHERQRIDRGVALCRQGAFAARWGIARVVSWLISAGALTAARGVAALVGRGRLSRGDEEILAPIWKLPPSARAALKDTWTQPRFFDALGSQIESICESAAEAANVKSFGDVPVVVVSATDPHPHHVMMQARLASLSAHGRRTIASTSGHWVPLDDPDAVVAAIRDVIEQIRSTR